MCDIVPDQVCLTVVDRKATFCARVAIEVTGVDRNDRNPVVGTVGRVLKVQNSSPVVGEVL